ncbi:MAG TPA: glycosyltransferase family 39 protein [Candidatus Limnocylindrales bacterium]|nr:glycosyltransferase family 39 protein [Candidatus Limnocylindrales bacterium]
MDGASGDGAPAEAAPTDVEPEPAPQAPLRQDWPWPAAVPWLVVGFALVAWLGRVDLLTPDEARHAEIAREMLLDGNWLTPRIYGEPYYDKPALFYWLIGGSLALFGHHAWAARLPSVLATAFTIAMGSWWIGRCWGRAAANYAAIMMATTLFFVAVGRYVVVDMLLTAALTGALSWLGVWMQCRDARRMAVWPLYVCTGVGLLAKGPVAAVVVAAVALVMAIFERRPRVLLELRPFTGALLVLAVAAPWYVAAYILDPRYIETFLWHHNLARFAVPGALEHQEPWYFYLVAVPICLLPWSMLLPSSLATAWRDPHGGVRHALAWATVVITFFSFSHTKLPTYVLAAFPPLIALMAAYVDDAVTGRVEMPRAIEAAAVGWTILAATIAIAGAAWIFIDAPSAWARAVLALPSLLVAAWAYKNAHTAPSIFGATAAGSLLLIAMVYGGAADALNARESQRGAADIVRAELPDYAALTSYRVAPHALAFYTRRPVRRADDPDTAVAELIAGAEGALLSKEKFLPELGLDPMPAWLRIVWSSGDGQVLVVGGSLAKRERRGDSDRWRRREGVEPSADR